LGACTTTVTGSRSFGRGAGHEGGADGAGGAGLVLDDHGGVATELLTHLAGELAGDQVGGAAGREGHDQGDGLVGPGEGGQAGGGRHQQREQGLFHGG